MSIARCNRSLTRRCSTMEKVELDRHSYEVQIKELAERAANSGRL